MFTEFAIAGALTYGIDKIRNRNFYREEKTFQKTCLLEDKSFLIINTWITQYGSKFLVSLKNKEYGDLEKLKEKLETNFSARVEMEQTERMDTAYVYVIKKRLNDYEFKFTEYKAVKPHEVYLGLDNKLEPITVNMNTFPHVLLSGATGSGKSELLRLMLSNLIANNTQRDIELYFSNISLSNDFYQFLNCKQVKSYVEKIEHSLLLFKHLNHIYEKRLCIFKKHDCLDIKEYNKKFKEKRMSYCYLCIDEFADYFPNNKQEDDYILKTLCYNQLRHLVRKGRKTGIFLVVGIQRPDTSVLDPSLRSNLCTKICFYQNNEASSLTVCDTGELINIKEREMLILYGNKRIWSRSLYINKSIIYNTIKNSIMKDRQKQQDFNSFLKASNININSSKPKIDKTNETTKTKGKAIDKPRAAKKVSKTTKKKTRVKNIEIIKLK